MSADGRRLGRGVARTLRIGTLVAVTAIAAGFVAALQSGSGPGPTPFAELVQLGGADALIGAGLLALTLIPVVALAVAGYELARAGEWRRGAAAAATLGLLLTALVAGVLIAGPS